MSELKRAFNPEFLNRIDDVVVFHPLTKEHLLEIVDILVTELNTHVHENYSIHLEVTRDLKEWLIQESYQPSYGARPMRRAIQKYIADPLSEEILRGKFKEANKIVVSLKDGITAFQEEESDMLAKV